MFFQFIRRAGFDESKYPDVKLKLWYIDLTLSSGLRPITNKRFYKEIIRKLSSDLFPLLDPVSREIKLVEYILPHILKNFPMLMHDPHYIESIEKPDITEKYAIKLKQRAISSKNNYSIILPNNENFSISKDTKKTLDKKLSLPEIENKCISLQIFFEKIGNFFTRLGIKISGKLEHFFRKLYDVKKIEENIEEEVTENSASTRRASNFIIKEWDEICEIIITTIKSTIDLDNKEKDIKLYHIRPNFSNTMMIFTKILEFIQLSAIGFKKEISWKIFQGQLATVSDSALIENNPQFLLVFWFSFAIAIIYCPFAWTSLSAADKNSLGKNEQGVKAIFFSIESLKKRLLILIGGSFYMFILKSQLSVFACDIRLDTPVVWNSDIICYESFHLGLLFSALASIFSYYPLATFIFPMLQFNDSSLDIRFQTTYLIVLSQIKLIITGITVFLPYEFYLQYQLGIASVVLLFLFVYTLIKQPCIAVKFNIWSSFGMFFAFATNFMGFINYNLGGSLLVNIIYFSIIGVSLIGTIVFYFIYSSKILKNKSQVSLSSVSPIIQEENQ